MLINNHNIPANGRKVKGQLPLEQIFAFCKTIRNITQNLGVHLPFKTADVQDFMYTTIAYAIQINVTTKSFYLHIPLFTPSDDTLAIFNESIKSIHTFP